MKLSTDKKIPKIASILSIETDSLYTKIIHGGTNEINYTIRLKSRNKVKKYQK